MRQLSNPNLTDVLLSLKDRIFYDLNCCRVGIITAFDSTNQTSSVQLVDKRIIINFGTANTLNTYPILTQCPTFVLGGSVGGFTIPISVGDECIVLFNDRDLEKWWIDGQVQAPQTDRAHDFTDAIVLVGIRSQINIKSDYNNSATEMNFGTTLVSLDSKVGIQNAAYTLKEIIDNFITIVSNLTVVTDTGTWPVSPTTISNLNTLSTQVADLLK